METLVKLQGCAGLSESLLLAYAKSYKISLAASHFIIR